MKVINKNGVEIDFETAVGLMDDELRERIHAKLAPCSEQEFFEAYEIAHTEEYSADWELSKANPIF